jgi:uncharacterized protein
MASERTSPSVWLLLDNRPGHSSQVLGLAQLMGWTTRAIELKFNALNLLPNPVLGAGLLSVQVKSRVLLKPPYPDVVVAMGRRCLPVARFIKQQSGNRCKIIMLGRKAVAGADVIDLLIGCIHFQQLPRPGLFALAVPPTKVNAAQLAALRQTTGSPFVASPAKTVLVLLGGPTAQHHFDVDDATALGQALVRAAAAIGGALAFVTSRRTPAAVIAALQAAAPSALFDVWDKHRVDNPYMRFLAHADVMVVTGESESMIAEAVSSQKPLTIYPLREKPMQLKHRLALRAFKAAGKAGTAGALARTLLHNGWLVPARDLKLMHQVLVERGQATVFEGQINEAKPVGSAEIELLQAEIKRLI